MGSHKENEVRRARRARKALRRQRKADKLKQQEAKPEPVLDLQAAEPPAKELRDAELVSRKRRRQEEKSHQSKSSSNTTGQNMKPDDVQPRKIKQHHKVKQEPIEQDLPAQPTLPTESDQRAVSTSHSVPPEVKFEHERSLKKRKKDKKGPQEKSARSSDKAKSAKKVKQPKKKKQIETASSSIQSSFTPSSHRCPLDRPCHERLPAGIPPDLQKTAKHPVTRELMTHGELLTLKYITTKTLNRFAELVGVTWSIGTFSKEEHRIIDEAMSSYACAKQLDKEAVQKDLYGARFRAEGGTPHSELLQDVAKRLHSRPIKSIVQYFRKNGSRDMNGDRLRNYWTSEEDSKMQDLKQHGKSWLQIGEKLSKPPMACQNRYYKHLKWGVCTRGRWTAEEEEQLAARLAAAKHDPRARDSRGRISWVWVAGAINGRSPASCHKKCQSSQFSTTIKQLHVIQPNTQA